MGEYYIKSITFEDGKIYFIVAKGCYADGIQKAYEVTVPSDGVPILKDVSTEGGE